MDDEVAPPPEQAARWSMLVAVPRWARVVVLGAGLGVAALLTHTGPHHRPNYKTHFISEGQAAWSVGFIVMAVAAALIADARFLGRMNRVGALLIAIGALLLIPALQGASDFYKYDVTDLNAIFYLSACAFAILLTSIGIAWSDLFEGLRLLVLISASAVGAFTVSGLWERRVFDGLNIVVVIVAWVAVIAVVTAMTLWTPNDRSSREPPVQGP